ncbi:MAG: hypothetical protein Q8O57_13350, partial [Kiritimatiellota bacterium]|nr:hypothetical protein [Kiritimatiellota bacterium]
IETSTLYRHANELGIDISRDLWDNETRINGVIVTQAELLAAVTEAQLAQTAASATAQAQIELEDGAFFRFNSTLATAIVEMADLGEQYGAVSGLAQTYTKDAEDTKLAQDNLTAAQAAYDLALTTGKGLEKATTDLGDARTAIEDLQTAQDLQTAAWVLNILTQQLSVGGLSSTEMAYLLQYQIDTGLITEEAAARAQATYDSALKMVDGYDAARDSVYGVTGALNGVPNIERWLRITEFHDVVYTGGAPPAGTGSVWAHGGANGLNGIVPPGFPNDSFLLGVQSGERVIVIPSDEVASLDAAMRGMAGSFNQAVNLQPAGAGAGAGMGSDSHNNN